MGFDEGDIKKARRLLLTFSAATKSVKSLKTSTAELLNFMQSIEQ